MDLNVVKDRMLYIRPTITLKAAYKSMVIGNRVTLIMLLREQWPEHVRYIFNMLKHMH